MEDPRWYVYNLSCCEKKAWRRAGVNEIRTHNPAIIAAVLMPNEMLLVLPKVINNASNLNRRKSEM